MKITSIAHIRLPTEKAHGIQIMKTCEALAGLGHEVTLLVPRRANPITASPFDYYGVKKNFGISFISGPDLVHWGKIGFLLQSLWFSIRASIQTRNSSAADIVYSRDALPLYLLSFFRRGLFFEVHQAVNQFMLRRLNQNLDGFVAITSGVKNFLVTLGTQAAMIAVIPDGVDLSLFSTPHSSEECRKKLALPLDRKLVVYTGHLYEWKGVDVLAQACGYLSEDVTIVFVGGTENDVKRFQKKYGRMNILILGQKPHAEIPLYLQAADVLVIPNSGKTDISRLYTSPIKLFEYMASGRPIVASDLPSLREILSDQTAFFAEPDDPQALASAITKTLQNKTEAEQKASSAALLVQHFSWNHRAEAIAVFIHKP